MSEIWRQHLQEIIEHRDDDDPRLAMAALVRPQDPDQTRYIELAVESGRRPRRERRSRWAVPPSAEEKRLLKRHCLEWAHTLRKYTAQQEFDRGFIAGISIEPYLFLEYGEWLLKHEPIQKVDFGAAHGGPFPVRELFESPLVAGLDAIALSNHGLTDQDVEVIAASPHLGRLLCLDLSHNPLTPRAFEALAAAPDTRKLLTVWRQQHGRSTYFPGPVHAPTGEDDERGYAIWAWTPLSPEGVALEERHGYIPWLHPEHSACDWLDARYYVDRGLLPHAH